MAAIDFPGSPSDGQLFNAPNGVTYQWKATPGMWVTVKAGTTPGGDFTAYNSAIINLTGSATALTGINTILTGNVGNYFNVANSRYTPPAGRYMIWVELSSFNGGGTGGSVALKIRKNGVALAPVASYTTVSGSAEQGDVMMLVDANGTDFFEVEGLTGASQGQIGVAQLIFGAFPISGVQGPPGPPGTPSCAFMVRATQNDTLSGPTTLFAFRNFITSTVDYDPDGVIGTAVNNREFTAPTAGKYTFTLNLFAGTSVANSAFLVNIRHTTNSGTLIRDYADGTNFLQVGGESRAITVTLNMAAGDKVQWLWAGSTAATYTTAFSSGGQIVGASLVNASGFRISN